MKNLMTSIKEKEQKLARKKAKGFTLVELIVVMIILAILAALLVPSLTGYIDKANNQAAIVEARQVLMAAQTTATEAYVKNKSMTAFANMDLPKILTLAEVGGSFKTAPVISNGKIQSFEYETSNGIIVKYTIANKFEVEDAAASS